MVKHKSKPKMMEQDEQVIQQDDTKVFMDPASFQARIMDLRVFWMVSGLGMTSPSNTIEQPFSD